MVRSGVVAMLAVALGGCPGGDDTSTTAPEDGTSDAGETVDEGRTQDGPAPETEAPPGAWFEVGWGTTEFNAYTGELPVVVGPQGLSMFSMPIRGAGFYNPPDPGFENPDMPMLQAWVDVEGFALDDDGHFNTVQDYPALFYPSLDDTSVLEGPAVWLVLPDEVDPFQLEGRAAFVHAELLDRDGLLLVDEHQLVIGEIPALPGGG